MARCHYPPQCTCVWICVWTCVRTCVRTCVWACVWACVWTCVWTWCGRGVDMCIDMCRHVQLDDACLRPASKATNTKGPPKGVWASVSRKHAVAACAANCAIQMQHAAVKRRVRGGRRQGSSSTTTHTHTHMRARACVHCTSGVCAHTKKCCAILVIATD